MEVRLEVRGQMEDMVVTVVLLRLVTACDSWLDIWSEKNKTAPIRRCETITQSPNGDTLSDSHHMRAVAGRLVRLWGSGGLAGQRRGGTGWVDALLFLPAVAEPNPDHLFLHVQLLRNQQDLLRGRLLVLNGKMSPHCFNCAEGARVIKTRTKMLLAVKLV